MSMPAGARIGSYEVIAAVGAGGMGEVYRARDTRLNRDVALKILPDVFASDPERLARFEREAQVLASLNHPHIAQIYGVEEGPKDAGHPVRALVLEFIDGETLADRIARGPIPIDEALPIARQIAEALEAAHEQGIIHRDLKPANIKLRPDGTVKVLDFGLAKLAQPAAAAPGTGAAASLSPTITSPALMTGVGMLLGTAAYMSPEQAKGREADKRSDIWAFGCVLFEMLTGQRAFEGEDVADTLAFVLTRAPAWSALPVATPPVLQRLLRRCLEKNRTKRLADIADARLDLEETSDPATPDAASSVVHASHGSRRRVYAAFAAVAALALIAIGAAVAWLPRQRSATVVPVRLSMELGADVSLVNQGAPLALSPDGGLLAFVAPPAGGGPAQLYLRRMTELQAMALSGTTNARDPFFSPDGQWIAFFADGKLKKISVMGGPALSLCDAPNGRGGAWAEDGWIAFQSQGVGGALSRVSAAGGSPQALTMLGQDETTQRWPQVLPGDKGVLYTGHARPAGFDDANIIVQALPNGARKVVQKGGYFGRYVDSGHLLFVRGGTLFARRFDIDRLEPLGEAVPVLEGVSSSATGSGVNGAAVLAVSHAGRLVYLPGGVTGYRVAPIEWITRTGKVSPLRAVASLWRDLRFSPDGRRLAMAIEDRSQVDIWIYEWARDALSRLTFDSADDTYPIWAPDGQSIAFASTRGARPGGANIYWQRADGTGEVHRLTDSTATQRVTSWHPSGRYLAIQETNERTLSDIAILPVEPADNAGWKAGKPSPFLNGPYDEQAATFSPDGRWIAYSSNESGRPEIYVRPFPGPGGKWQVSTDGGLNPTWSSVRRELLYQTLDDHLSVVTYEARESFVVQKPQLLIQQRLLQRPGGNARGFDLHPDGDRIAAATAPEVPAVKQDKVVFVSNIVDELTKVTGVAPR